MFGYVRPPLQSLPPEETARFRKVYCGLCHTLKRRYGFAASFVLNYDFTFLALLLLSGEPTCQSCSRCMASPLRRQMHYGNDDALDLAADESIILTYWQLLDGVADHSFISGIKYRLLSGFLSGAYRKAAAARPEFNRITRQQLNLLHKLEQEQCSSIDRTADAFAVILRAAADALSDPVQKRILSQFLYHLGRWVYLIDAGDDLKDDIVHGNYNPLALRYRLHNGCWTPEAQHDFAQTLDHSIHMMATAYELWDFGVWAPIIEGTVYGSLFAIGRAVMDGTFQRRLRMPRFRKKPKDGEEYK